jgi:hypothetical protein
MMLNSTTQFRTNQCISTCSNSEVEGKGSESHYAESREVQRKRTSFIISARSRDIA